MPVKDSHKTHMTGDTIHTVTNTTFNESVLDGEGPIAVEFMSYGCNHCRTMEAVLQEVASDFASKEKIFRVNTATDQALSETYQIHGTPTFILFLNGQEVGRVEGPKPNVQCVTTALLSPFES
jgi:thioredoxin 1